MKKTFLHLLKNFILLSIPLVLLCVYTVRILPGCFTVEYAQWEEEKYYVNHPSPDGADPDILVIGDSRAKSGLIPSRLSDSKKIYNIAIGGATGIEMYYALKNYLKHHKAPETAIIIFAPYHFCEIDNWGQTLFYDYLTLPELLETEWEACTKRDEALRYGGWASDILSFKLRLPNKYLDTMITSRFGGNREKIREKEEKIREASGFTSFGEAEGNDELNYETHHPDFDLSPIMDRYFYRLIALLRDEGIQVIVEQSPVNEASDKVITEKFRKGYDEYLTKAEESFPGTVFEKEVPVYENSCFGDNNHLNLRGAEMFTEEIRQKYPGLF